jgi:hypothetical protein
VNDAGQKAGDSLSPVAAQDKARPQARDAVCGFKFMRVLTRLGETLPQRGDARADQESGRLARKEKLIRGRHLAFPMAEVALCLRCLNRLSVVRVMNSRRICASPYAE